MNESVTTDFDLRETTFSVSGFLNFILRYGGGVGDFRGSTASQLRKIINLQSSGGADPFKVLRRSVLEQADKTDRADAIVRKIVTYTGEASGGVSKAKPQSLDPADTAHLDDVRKSISCSPAYKVVPQIAIHRQSDGGLLAINTAIEPVGNTGVIMQPKGITVNLITNTGHRAGLVPIYEGTIELDFFAITKNTKLNILQQITRYPESLGYMFQMSKDYRISLNNLSKKQKFATPKDKQAYEALVKTGITFNANTLRYELTSFKPYENRATFTIYFTQGGDAGNKIKKDGFKGVKVQDPPDALKIRAELRKAQSYSLMDGILTQIQRNGSLFLYTFSVTDQPWLGIGSDTLKYQIRNTTATAGSAALESRTVKEDTIMNGSFFLFRSLLIAVLQTFYKEETSLLESEYGNILYDKEAFRKMLLVLDLTGVPNGVGTFFSEGPDVRNTFETMVVEFQVFVQFMHDLHAKHNRVTFEFFMSSLFNDLVPRIIKASVNPKGPSKERYRCLYRNTMLFDMNIKQMENSLGDGYKIRTREINLNELNLKKLKPINQVYRQQLHTGAGTTQKLTREQLAPYGLLRFKNCSSARIINSILNLTPGEPTANAIVLDSIGALDVVVAAETKQKQEFARLKNDEIRSKGIVPLDWYMKGTPKENLKFRLLSSNGETPFKFAVMNNKNADTDRRNLSGEKAFYYNIYTVSFSVADVLGIKPNVTRFFFKPQLFGFDSVEEDSFGFAAVYQCTGVTISYNQGNSRFEADIEMIYESKVPAKSPSPIGDGDRTPVEDPEESDSPRIKNTRELLRERTANDLKIAQLTKEAELAKLKTTSFTNLKSTTAFWKNRAKTKELEISNLKQENIRIQQKIQIQAAGGK